MSTVVYAILTRKREEAMPGTSTSAAPPGVKSYVDVLAALVPGEVLAIHALVLSFTTATQQGSAGSVVTKITDPVTLRWVFAALILMSAALYVMAHRTNWDPLDYVRVLIPPFAFVGWTMLQKTTAFDALGLNVGDAPRSAIAIIGAVVLGGLAGLLAYQADQKVPSTRSLALGDN